MSLTSPDSAILYVGVENKIEVTGLNEKAYIRLKSGKGEISRKNLSPSIFNVQVSSVGTDAIELYHNNKLILTRAFQIRTLTDPVPLFGNLTDSTATLQEIILNPTINVSLPNCYYNHDYRVIYFKTTILSSKGRVEVFDRTNGNRLTKDQIKSINQLKKGNKILLTEISATCPDCATRRLRDLTIIIK